MTKTNFRGTEITDFLRCPKRYDYAWNQQLEPKQRNEKLTIGSAIHKFLESHYSTKFGMSTHWSNELIKDTMKYIDENSMGMDEPTVQDMKELVQNVCANYLIHYGLDFQWDIVAVEKEFSIYLESGLYYTGTIDLLVRDCDGKYWIVDHKTTNAIDIYDKNSDMDRQISRYWYAVSRYFDIDVEGFIYNIILKDYPVAPKVLKSGALSKDKSQRTTKQLYLKAIADNELNPDDYADFLQHLEEQPKEFFRRLKVERNIEELRASISEMTDVIFDIRDKQRKTNRWYRNITKDCHWDCAFKTLCQAEMDGSNADHIRNELFKVKEIESNDGEV